MHGETDFFMLCKSPHISYRIPPKKNYGNSLAERDSTGTVVYEEEQSAIRKRKKEEGELSDEW